MHCAIQKAEALDGAHLMRILWQDGVESVYPAVWLRDNCQCPDCYLDSAKARKLLIEALDVNIGIKGLTFDRKKVHITWPNDHYSEYEADWLKKRCFSQQAREKLQRELFLPECQYWGSEFQLPTLDFEDVLKDDEHAYRWLSRLKKVGIVRLTGASDKRGEVLKLGKRIGFLYLTFYGHTWQVQDKIDANNVAYTTGKLSFHTDYPALHHPPGVQLLHCIKQTVTGGDSEIVDGFNVCQKLKEKNPWAFQILSSTFVDFTDIGVDYCDFSVQSKHKIIELDDKGQVVRINFNNATRDTIFDVPVERVQPFYAALKEFVDLMNCKEFKFTFKMNPGDVITFDNWRLLHGRRSYEAGTEISRHLEGAYADWDVVMSRLRILRQSVRNRN
ncbi:gamma-butyrobetaine dioxygenase [Neophocaena asiaeorientalis asiaeorientalis]|uniref:Gamma-butyrobetaine dioxygenase n=3 Tax=Odontoceti TaxID=9722 RepID=A0A341D0G8_NEOAA|nr:gamma-butyrobetaine dioxygenase [Neophocaena asiaeorientalis asiaeorientalis]XP_024620508.1 gamma-butyrobetaine dioxygenase [Neophocaena asiaeorientalis asiaeorientalis]XP_032497974.1 gamma-butyrobetaine dioxygenase [Phocoena sinus]XP_032497975.1 gamma-butyrobetaine dioxygenase [Phocoena sinus]XP_033265523.1 gamma-butyrobetaine dioxygenase [Orcinus orca]XP_033265527.1 gamma-butyrobetaine dioxygenase [Orcinus orca]XP_059874606.1 gamma-butyrobetaine dioxygenase [Delphinus delphis]XP_0598746